MDVEGKGKISREEFFLIMDALGNIAYEKGKTGVPAGHWVFGLTGSQYSARQVVWLTFEDP